MAGDHGKEARRRYYENYIGKPTNRHKKRKREIQQREKANGIVSDFPLGYCDLVHDVFGKRCINCGSKEHLTFDHHVPITSGGAFLHNAVPLCLAFPQGSRVTVVMVPVVIMLIFGMTLGLGLLLAGLNVYFRDIEHILTAIGLPWFFLTPIFWTFQTVQGTVSQDWVLGLLHWGNPIAPGTIALQDALFWGRWPTMGDLLYTAVAAVVLIGVGLWAFKKLKREMAVEL